MFTLLYSYSKKISDHRKTKVLKKTSQQLMYKIWSNKKTRKYSKQIVDLF